MSTAPTPDTLAAAEYAELQHAPIADLHGRRMQQGVVVEHTTDLAIADRVAYVLATRTGRMHLVLAETGTYAIMQLLGEAADGTLPPTVVAIATDEGIRPVLAPPRTAYDYH